MSRAVLVLPHDPEWTIRFASEARRIAEALGPNVVAIHHIGSTAIPGLPAKPIIDVLVEVSRIADIASREPAMVARDYEAKREYGLPGRRYFRKSDRRGVRTHHVHCYEASSPEVARHLAFRDFVREHPDTAREYAELKQTLASAHPDDSRAYAAGKAAFIQRIDVRASAVAKTPRPSDRSAGRPPRVS